MGAAAAAIWGSKHTHAGVDVTLDASRSVAVRMSSIAPRIHADVDAIERMTQEIPRRDLRGTSLRHGRTR
jgi:hypothetical protein